MLSLSGHIGAKASALVDGQLPPAEEERAWSHVLTCPGCRRLVEREGWVKRQLCTLGSPQSLAPPPPQLLGSLYAVDAWSAVDRIERHSRRRRTAAVVVGGGAAGALAIGLLTVTGGPTARPDIPSRPSPAMIRGEQPARTPVGSPTGAETNTSPAWVRRSR